VVRGRDSGGEINGAAALRRVGDIRLDVECPYIAINKQVSSVKSNEWSHNSNALEPDD
jgi:hypothetical protein